MVRECDESLDVHSDLTDLGFEEALRKRAIVSKSGVVHEKVDLEPLFGHLCREPHHRFGVAEVRRLDFRPDAGWAELLGEAVETIGPASDEHDVVSALGELSGELLADAR